MCRPRVSSVCTRGACSDHDVGSRAHNARPFRIEPLPPREGLRRKRLPLWRPAKPQRQAVVVAAAAVAVLVPAPVPELALSAWQLTMVPAALLLLLLLPLHLMAMLLLMQLLPPRLLLTVAPSRIRSVL